MEILSRFLIVALIMVFLGSPCFATGPFGNVPGNTPVEPIHTYSPVNKKPVPTKPLPDSAIYSALTTAPNKAGKKVVGGLTCTQRSCTLDKKYVGRAIYAALKVTEKNITSPLVTGSTTLTRTVGRLHCTRTYAKVKHPSVSYACLLK